MTQANPSRNHILTIYEDAVYSSRPGETLASDLDDPNIVQVLDTDETYEVTIQ